jgi:SAM-dependent methyltransferase
MQSQDSVPEQVFDETYFSSGAYAEVSFDRYSQYWWSNRYYALLTRRYGPPGGRVLEIGCGLGHLLERLADRYSVFGTDVNAWALTRARNAVPEGSFIQASAEDLGAFPDQAFQIVIAKHVVEHLSDPERAISEMSRVLSNDGLLLLATPNLDSPTRILKRDRWIGYKDATHISLKRPNEWLDMLARYQLNPGRVFSDGFWDAPYLPWLPEAFQKVFFGWPGGLQAIFGWSIIPLRLGESLIVIARKL